NSLVDELLGRWPKRLARHSFDNFELPGSTGYSIKVAKHEALSLRAAHEAATAFSNDPEKWLVFVGDGGRGKTHLAAAIKNDRMSRGQPALFMTVPDLLQYLRQTYHPNSHH